MLAFWFCPKKWEERYENNLEPRVRNTDALDFGKRMHELLEGRHLQLAGHPARDFVPLSNPSLEAEAQLTLAAYEAYYPEEPFEVVAVEKYFEVPLPCAQCLETFGRCYDPVNDNCSHHTYNGEFDAIIRDKISGKLKVLETKTESRSSKSNSPEAWISRSQVGLYQWAAEQIYGEPIEEIVLNIITRQSPKGLEPPCFRRDNLHRTVEQQRDAVKNLVWVADRIEEMQRDGFFPSNRNACVSPTGWKCDYFDLHVTPEGRPVDELIQIKFKQAEEYLAGGL